MAHSRAAEKRRTPAPPIGSPRRLPSSKTAAHAAGLRGDPRASALAEAIDVLCVPDRKAADPYDFPTELVVLVVGRDVAEMVHTRTSNGFYTSPDEVVGSAMHALEFAEKDPEGSGGCCGMRWNSAPLIRKPGD